MHEKIIEIVGALIVGAVVFNQLPVIIASITTNIVALTVFASGIAAIGGASVIYSPLIYDLIKEDTIDLGPPSTSDQELQGKVYPDSSSDE